MWCPSEASRFGEMSPPERGRPRPGRVGVRGFGGGDEEFGGEGGDGDGDGDDDGDGDGDGGGDDDGWLM